MAFWDSIGKAARGAYYQINPFDRGLTYSDSFRSGEERKRKQQQQAPRPQQPQNTQYVNGLVSGGGVKAQEDRRREVARQAARQQVQNPIGGFLAGVLNKGKSVAEDYVDLNKKGLDLLKDPQKILDGGEIVRKAIVNATPPVQLYNRVRTAQRVQQGRQQVSKYEQDVNNQVKEAFGGQVTNLNDAIKTLSARRSELNPNEKKALLTLLNVNRQIAEDRRTIEEGNLQNVDPVGILEDALVFGGEPVANLTREIFTRGPARIVKEIESNKLAKAMVPFIGETSKGIDVAQESNLGKFIFGRGKVDKASDDIKSFTKDIPILRDIFKYAPLATAGGIAVNLPGIGGTSKVGKFGKAAEEISKVDNADDVIKVIGQYDDLAQVFGSVDDTLKPGLLEKLVKETKPKEIQKVIQKTSEASKSLQFTDDLLRAAKSSESVSEFAKNITDDTVEAILKASKSRAKTPEANIIADLLKTGEITPKSEELFSNLKAVVDNKPQLGAQLKLADTPKIADDAFKQTDDTIAQLSSLDPEQAKLVDDLAKQAGFAGLDDVARTLQPKAVSNISEATPPTINTSYGLGTQATTAIVEKDQPIIRVLRKAEKQTGRKGIVDQFMYDSGLQSRSASIANQKLTSNPNLKEALGGLSKRKLKDLNAYSAARSELSNAGRGLQTSLPVSQLQKIVDDLSPQYAGRFERLNAFYKDLASDLRDAGIIDEARYQQFIASPDYVRIQRDMSDLINFKGQGGNTYSLGATITRQKRIGSKRAIKGADVTAFDYTQQVQKEIQRNQTAGNLIDVLAENNLAKRLEPTEAVRKNTIKRIVNGKTEIYEVDPEIKKVIENVAPYQLNTLEKIVAMPKRVFQATTTGLSAPFALANYVKDQVGSAINSKRIIATHSPNNIFSGIFQATKDFGVTNNNEMWQKFIAHAGDTTQYDLTRGTKSAKRLSRELRRGEIGFVANRITSPLKSLEDLIAITEKSTRYQNFRGMYKSLIKKGGNESDALREATLAAWQNSVDFNRYGNWGKTLNLLIPYFNSGIQGSRQLVRSFKNRPIATSIKSIATVGLPIAGVTAWNLSDPERKAIYDNISEFEKENGLVIIPPGPLSQNEDGTYNVWKIPLTQGYNQLFGGVRRAMETYSDKEPTDFGAIALDIIGAVSGPIQTRGGLAKTGSSLIPQGIKPIIQQAANKDFFTGKDIVPDFIENATAKDGSPIPEEKKAFKYTSGSAKAIGRLLGKSPIRVEKFLKDTFGKVGQYGENAADNVLAKLGIIKPNEIGGVSVKDDITRRFTKAQGEYNYKKSDGAKYFDDVKAVTSSLNGNEKSAYDTLHPQKTSFLGEDIFDENKRLTSFQKAGIYLQYPKVFEADRALDKKQRAKGTPGNPIFDLPKDQLTRILLKATLPPGAKDPELSKLWEKDWYQDYNAKRTKYYEAVKKSLKKQGKTLPKSNNPYPETPKNLQKVMDYYSSLPKGTGDRSNWIESNPTLWKKMTKQWEAVDNWENKERVKLGLDKIAPEDQLGATSNKYGYGSSGKGGKSGKSGKTAKNKRVPLSSLTSYIRGLGTDIPDVASQIRAPEVRLNLPRPVASRAKRVKINFRG